jgi:hypothetical protein
LVGAQLIITLRSVLGSEFTPDVEKAWTDIYSVVSAQMQAGVTEVAPVSLPVGPYSIYLSGLSSALLLIIFVG